jgi:hypothetical protein
MKPSQAVRLLLVFPLLVADVTQAAINLLPGVTYYEGREALTGKLTFLLSRDVTLGTNSSTSASVYEFELSEQKLRKVADAPQGLFVPSNGGDSFCVIYGDNHGLLNNTASAFVYSDSMRKSGMISLESEPQQIVTVGGHVFFTLETVDTANNTLATKLLDYDIAHVQRRQVEFADASKWQYQHYDRIHVPRGLTNILHFYYKGYGNRLGGGKDYRDGYYSLDLTTGEMRWIAELLDDKDDEAHTYQASDGRYVFFEGPDAPFRGFKLMSSPWDFLATKSQDPKGEKVKVLKAFSRLSAFGGNAYMVSQMSPDGRYVLVRLQEPSVPKSAAQPGWMNTYFLVNASNGESRVLLKEEVEHTASGSMSAVRWFQ